MILRTCISVILLVCLASMAHAQSTAPATQPASIVPFANGDFETDDGNGWFADWPHPAGATRETEGGNHFLRLKLLRTTQFLSLNRSVAVRPTDKAYRLTVRARYEDMHYGKEMWWDGRILLTFKDVNGNKVGGAPAPHWNKGSKDWRGYTYDFLVPDGAVKLDIIPSLIRVPHGTLDLDDLSLETIDPAPVIAKDEEAKTKAAEKAAAQIAGVKATVPVAPADKLPAMLHARGNQLLNASGQPVLLQGVCIPSLEWTESGENMVAKAQAAITDWHANCIRLPVTDKFWFGHGPYRHDGGAQYQQIIDDVVNLCAANGVYVVIDLHGFTAPKESDATFWASAARKYRDHPAVIYELFNEPHDISWEIWRDGGEVTPPREFADAPPEDQVQPKPYKSVGMQKLLDTVRDTDAKNLVIAGGIEWGYDLSGVVNQFALTEHGGNGIMYSSHLYPWKKDWQKNLLDAAAKYPIFVGEVGCPPDYTDYKFVAEADRLPLADWAQDVLGLVQKNKLNWTAWSFHDQAGPCLLLDTKTFTPTPYWGVLVKDALAGKQFEMKKLR